MTRDEAIARAVDAVGDAGFRPGAYARVNVRNQGDEVWVSFEMPVRYVPFGSAYYCSVGVGLGGGIMARGAVSNPPGMSAKGYAMATPEGEAAAALVLKAIGVSEAELPEDTTVTIMDGPEQYGVTVASTGQESTYRIDKGTGEVLEQGHAHLEPDPEEKEEGE